MILHGLVCVLIQYQLTEHFLILEVLLLVILKQVLLPVEIVFELLNFFKQLALARLLIHHFLAFDLGGDECFGVDGVALTLHEFNSFEEDVLFILKLLHDDGNLNSSLVLYFAVHSTRLSRSRRRWLPLRVIGHLT